jgi:predicted GTPase
MELDKLPIDSNITDSISQFIKENALNNLEAFTENQLNQWKNCPLNIAITGNSGVGKSTLINTIRSLRAYDKGAADVNVIECTQERTCYIHPDNENLKLWDLPGLDLYNFYEIDSLCFL